MHNYTKQDIINTLKNLGIKKGDNLFVHANIGFFGKLEGAKTPQDYYNIFKEAIFDVITEEGTFISPTFSYSFCKKQTFYPDQTPSTCGILAEMIRQDKSAIRSLDANFSITAIGKNAKFFTENPTPNSFEKGSFFDKFLQKNGIFCNFNFDSGSTFIHYVEKCNNVPYRWDKAFEGKIILPSGEELEKTFYHFVYDPQKQNHTPDFTKFDKKAKELNLTKTHNLGKGQVLVISAKDSYELITGELKTNPNFLIKGEI